MAVIPVPVVGLAPARVPLITRAPVTVGRRSRRRLGDAAGQSESEHRQSTARQHAGAKPNPRSRSQRCTHTSIVSLASRIPKRFGDSDSAGSYPLGQAGLNTDCDPVVSSPLAVKSTRRSHGFPASGAGADTDRCFSVTPPVLYWRCGTPAGTTTSFQAFAPFKLPRAYGTLSNVRRHTDRVPTLSPGPSTETSHRETLASETPHLRNHFPDLGRTCYELSRLRRSWGTEPDSDPFRSGHVGGGRNRRPIRGRRLPGP